jgi:hypothetical protein
MRIPFLHRRERTVAEIAAKATRVGSAEAYGPAFQPSNRTSAEHREAIRRIKRLRENGGSPS